jgi:ubiquinone/menaquinone biosynthesis C-methylase UbiE
VEGDEAVEFRDDLYRGTAPDYDRFRLPYHPSLTSDLLSRCGIEGGGRLLDLACGTGQIAFALRDHFDEVWAIDQEPEAVAFGRHKAELLGVDNIRWIVEAAEALDAGEGAFDLVAIGNAFHRLHRREVAGKAFGWLREGGHLAVLGSDVPWRPQAEWQRVLSDVMERWVERLHAADRVPSNWEEAIERDPHDAVLARAGFEIVGRFEFFVPHEWTVEALAGFVFGTSVLPRSVVGDLVPAFEADLRQQLLEVEPTGVFEQTLSFAYDLARRPQNP